MFLVADDDLLDFTLIQKAVQDNFETMKHSKVLFEVDLDKDELYDLYQDAFPSECNPIFRERRHHDCSCCKQFIRSIGNVVSLNNGKITTVWDIDTGNDVYNSVAKQMSDFVKQHKVSDVYFNDSKKVGTLHNYEEDEDGEIITWNHFFLELPSKFVQKGGDSIATIQNEFRGSRDVFKRSLDEITVDSILTVLELISQNSLYKGEEWKQVLKDLLQHKKKYKKLDNDEDKNIYAWENSTQLYRGLTRIRNHSMGVLLVDISEGMNLDKAVKRYEDIVAPENYQRSKPIFTKKMLEDAKKKIEELGYTNSLPRRFATIDDISVNDILFSNKDVTKKLQFVDVFDEMEKEISVNPKKFSKVEEIGIKDFVEDVLPTANELEAFLENKHDKNMVSLIAPQNEDSESMFKWNNNFSWAYTGNITDSSMKENVKSAGGKVDGVLRFSIQWNDDDFNPDDLDAHCVEPNGNEIYYGNDTNINTRGRLDVDIIHPKRGKPAVENITWTSLERMEVGKYKFYVNNYSNNGGKDGFKAEIEFNGEVYEFEYSKPLTHKQKVQVAEVCLDKDGNFTIEEKLPSEVSSKEVWGLQTNKFIPVSIVMNSPNYWTDEDGVGNKHYFFMLKEAENPEMPNGIFVEFLNSELRKHRKVMESLGVKLAVEDDDKQLSGVGFSSTKRNDLIVKVKGQTERVLKVKF